MTPYPIQDIDDLTIPGGGPYGEASSPLTYRHHKSVPRPVINAVSSTRPRDQRFNTCTTTAHCDVILVDTGNKLVPAGRLQSRRNPRGPRPHASNRATTNSDWTSSRMLDDFVDAAIPQLSPYKKLLKLVILLALLLKLNALVSSLIAYVKASCGLE
ncbi:LAMI_0B08042g1_1 [Lachancea mirantina]|uniref:LAMI_0B08042g1_1 n=1 Tax=Lachancea mirantina TaxID=1230905 RepID=A0A1G4IXZ8_9SACH|nr:LAMI_0B08042g1_1 [Lachancea mirantina]